MDNPNPVDAAADANKDSVERMTMELRILKKRLYTYQFKGLQLQERARNHMLAQQAGSCEGIDVDDDLDERTLRLFGENDKDIKSKAFGSSRNPLSNEYILEMVATHLPIQDIRSCRQVCKLWSEEFSRCYLKRKAIIIALKDDLEEAEEILKLKSDGNCVNVSSLVALDMPVESKIIQDIVTAFGSTMNSLTVDDCNVTAQELYSILRQTPYLETLHMKTSVSFGRMRGGEIVMESIMDQITSDSFAPGLQLSFLKKLVWEDFSPIRSFERLPVAFPILASLKVVSLGDCRPSRFAGLNWDSLKTIYLRAEENWKASQFQSLIHLNLKLKSLSLRKIKPGGKLAMERLHEFISSQSETLVDATLGEEVHLNLSMNSGSMNVLSENRMGLSCEMKKLKSVRIDFGFWNSLDIVDKLPALETLDLRSRIWRNWWIILKKDKLPSPHSNMKQLTLGAIDNECLRKIAICFPAITFLEVSGDRIGNWALRTICSSMPQLSCLKISKPYRASNCPTITDSGLTGMSSLECKRILRTKLFDAVRVRQFPFIGDLKELQVFEIESQSCCKITDVGVFCGIATLPKLKILTLPKGNMSERAWKKVKSTNHAFIKFPGLKKYFPIATGSLDSPTFILTDLFTDE